MAVRFIRIWEQAAPQAGAGPWPSPYAARKAVTRAIRFALLAAKEDNAAKQAAALPRLRANESISTQGGRKVRKPPGKTIVVMKIQFYETPRKGSGRAKTRRFGDLRQTRRHAIPLPIPLGKPGYDTQSSKKKVSFIAPKSHQQACLAARTTRTGSALLPMIAPLRRSIPIGRSRIHASFEQENLPFFTYHRLRKQAAERKDVRGRLLQLQRMRQVSRLDEKPRRHLPFLQKARVGRRIALPLLWASPSPSARHNRLCAAKRQCRPNTIGTERKTGASSKRKNQHAPNLPNFARAVWQSRPRSIE